MNTTQKQTDQAERERGRNGVKDCLKMAGHGEPTISIHPLFKAQLYLDKHNPAEILKISSIE
jgi:hypothetical protein